MVMLVALYIAIQLNKRANINVSTKVYAFKNMPKENEHLN